MQIGTERVDVRSLGAKELSVKTECVISESGFPALLLNILSEWSESSGHNDNPL